jgi:acyl transferase domain-containing protein
VDRCLDLLKEHVDGDLRSLLFARPDSEPASAELQRPSRALPALFTTQYAQARLWMSWGIVPTAMIGHSMGEYTAACLSGVLSLEDALAIVALRGRLFETLPRGGMLSVPLPAEELSGILPPELSLAAINAPELSLASGPVEAIEALQETLLARDIEGQRLHIDVAAHSSMLEPILAPFGEALRQVRFGEPQIPFVSNLSGTWITAAEAADPDYWVRHLRNTVDFAGGVGELLERADRVLLEVGPGRVLSTLARLHPARTSDHEILHSMRHPGEEGSDVAFQLTALGRLWIGGVPVDWEALHGGARRRRVPLPTYPFEHQPYWIAPGRRAGGTGADEGVVDPARRGDVGDWFWQPSWRRSSPPAPLPDRMEGERILLLADGEGPGAGVGEALRRRGAEVIQVGAGEGFQALPDGRFTVCPGREDDLDRLVEGLTSAGRVPGIVIHALAAGVIAPGDDLEGIEAAEDRAFHSLLGLARAMARGGWDQPLRLSVLTSGAQQVASEEGIEPLQSLALGPVAVIGREFPHIRTRLVDLAPGSGALDDRQADRTAAALLAPGEDAVVALRGRDRWLRTFEPLRLPAAEGPAPRVREGSTVLITGGLGGLGLVMAEEFAGVPGVRLVLAGRSGLPARDEWDAWLQGHDDHDRTVQAIRTIRRLESRGARVVPAAVDVVDAGAVRILVREIRERFGRLDGVIHAAGVVEDALILNKDRASAARVLAPKVRGTMALASALRGHPPDFLVLFSSRGAVTGVPGQVDYAAANTFLDAWARACSGDASLVVSINWSAWKEVGLAFDLVRQQTGTAAPRPRPVQHPLLDGIEEEDGVEVFSSLFSPERQWVLDEHRIRGGHPLIPGTGYLELARAAFTHRPGTGALVLRDVYFLQPFVVPHGRARALRIRMKRKGATGRFSILGAPAPLPAAHDVRWTEHARGVAEWSDEAPPARLDLEGIRARCNGTEVQGIQEKAHLQLGARWGSLRWMRHGEREALLMQELPAKFLGDLELYPLHPALLDTATAGAQALIEGFDEERDFYVPASYTRLVQYRPVPARIHSHVRWRPDPDGGKEFALFDVTVTDDQGEVVLEVTEFIMVRVADRSQMEVEEPYPSADAGDPVGAATGQQPLPADEELPPMLREAIRTSEGIDAFRRIMAAESPPQVIVSPHDLRAVLAGLDQPATPAAGGRKARSAPVLDTSPVEARLLESPAVREAAVQAFEDRPGELRLVAWVVYDPIERATVSELRRFLRGGLDETLIPQNFVEMEALPRREDGSVARDRLEDPFAPVDDHVEPRTDTEGLVAEIWMDLLGADRVSVHDNFLDVGGHSLLATRALLRIERETGVRLNPSVMNMHTLEQIAAEIDESREGGGEGDNDASGPGGDGEPPSPQGLRRFFSGIVRG